jgi:hypothetical protein
VGDNLIIAGMRSRMIQLRQIGNLAHNPEIRALVLKVADDIQAEVQRLEAGGSDLRLSMPQQTS